MKLISCYIENFGGLSRYSQEFQEGLTVIHQPNGFGKTTLAEFIRAMFYGFPRKTPKQLGRRQKYHPWNGGKYGGHLTFEHEGRCYRVERTFGATPKGDTFQLIDVETGRKSSRFPEEVGLALFGLDSDSYERSTYLAQSRDSGPMTTDSIRAKLSDLVEDTGDVGNYEKAVQSLRSKRSGYIPYRGSGGTVAEAQARITRLQQMLDTAEESRRMLPQMAAETEQLRQEKGRVTAQIEKIRHDLTAANEAAARLAHHQHHDRLTSALAQAEAELEALRQRYPQGFPESADLEAVTEAVEQAARLASQQPITDEDRKAQRFVEHHQGKFENGVPGEAEFDAMRKTWDDRRTAEARLDACALPAGEEGELRSLEEFFVPGLPAEEELERYEAHRTEADRLRQENLRLAAQTAETVPVKVADPLTLPLLLAGGIVAIVAGIVRIVRGDHIPGGVLLALGVLALLGAGYLHLRRGKTRQIPALSPQLQAMIRENEERAAALDASARTFGAKYAGAAPEEIRRRMTRLDALKDRQESLARTCWELNARVAELDAALDGFFEKYHYRPEGDAYDGLNRLQRICETWLRARQLLAARDERVEQHRRETAEVRAVLEAFREKYGIAPTKRAHVLAIRDDIRRAGELAASADAGRAQLVQYRREHADALAAPAEETEDPARLRRREAELLARQSALTEQLLQLDQQTRQLQEAADKLPQLQDELVRWQDRKEADRESAAILDDTMDFLARAKDNLATAYMGPIKTRFAELMARMAGEEAGKILVTPELEVKLERFGESRELAYFSAGQTDLVMLCMRLALVDALFREARPALILDDPFVNLDDAHTREALALLQELARDRQIVYLVCSAARVSESFVK